MMNCVDSCLEKKCPLWVELKINYDLENNEKKTEFEGKCTFAWIPILLVELKQEIQKISNLKI